MRRRCTTSRVCNSAPLSMYFRIGTPAASAYAPTMYKMSFAS